MPRYDYKCAQCGEIQQLTIPYDARDSELGCPFCEGRMMRQLSAPSVHFKGEGWTPRYHR